MKDKERIIAWIETIIIKAATLENNQGVELLHDCGKDCSFNSELLKSVVAFRNELPKDADIEYTFQSFKNQYYTNDKLSKAGNITTLIFDKCTCPLVKGGISNPFLCNCTVGYTKQIFETLFAKPVEIRLLKSILKGDSICEQEVIVSDV
jgi:hypothetical protein